MSERLTPAQAMAEYARQLAEVEAKLPPLEEEIAALEKAWHRLGHLKSVASGFVMSAAGAPLMVGMPAESPAELEAEWKETDERLLRALGKRGELRDARSNLKARIRQIEHLVDPSV